MTKKLTFLLAVAALALGVQAQKLNYPQAPADGTVDEYFGVKVPDPYRPLEDDNSTATAGWVQAENALTQSYLGKLTSRPKILKRLKQLSNYGKVSAPWFEKHTGKWYFSKNDGLQNQSVIYVMDRLGDEQNARVFLDPNKLSDDGTVALKTYSFSRNGRYLAYGISRSGSDWQEFYVKDLTTGQLLPDHIEWAKFSGASWQGDGFYYSAYDRPEAGHTYSSKNSTHKIYYHKVGTQQSEDKLFYQNPTQPMEFFSIDVNDEETLQMLYESGQGAGSDLWVRDLREPGSQFIRMTSDQNYIYSPIEYLGDKILIVTNYGAPRYRLMVADVHNPGISNWTTLVPEGPDVMENATVIDGKLVLTYMHDACTRAEVRNLSDGSKIADVSLPGVGTAAFYGDKDRPECFYSFSSFTKPGTVYQYDLATNKSNVYAQPKVNIDLDKFTTEEVFFTSKDGTRVPMFVTHRKDMKLNGKNPTYLYYNPQNEMFRKNKTKRSAPQNEMFLFRVPSPQHKTPQISLGRFCFQTIYIFRRSIQTSRSRHLQVAARCVLSCSRIYVRFRGSALCSSRAVLSALP